MEYVVYLSKAKVDMLYNQIERDNTDISAEGTINVGIFAGRLTRKKSEVENYFHKLNKAIHHIGNIGTIYEENVSYITGAMEMAWETFRMTRNAIFWYGESITAYCHTNVLLIGSAKNIIGNAPDEDGFAYSPLANFIMAYAKELEVTDKSKCIEGQHKNISVRGLFDYLRIHYKFEYESFSTQYKFLAKSLCQRSYKKDDGTLVNYIIASPLYVSIR